MHFLIAHLLHGAVQAAKLTLSIGISDGIELYTEPRVHKYHNAPDIMNITFDKYTVLHAAMSGMKLSWFLFVPACLLIPFPTMVVNTLSVMNIMVPLVVYFIKSNDYYLGHKILYGMNSFILGGTAIYVIINKVIFLFY